MSKYCKLPMDSERSQVYLHGYFDTVEVDEQDMSEATEKAWDEGYRTGLRYRDDDWHPASRPPTPEDFEPTGNVECLEKFDKPQIGGRTHGAFTHWKTDSWQSEAAPFCTHWRRITPPKP